MKKFAGTFHKNKQGDWARCITEGGRPCSRHTAGEHIKGANLEEALETLHKDDDFGLGYNRVSEHADKNATLSVNGRDDAQSDMSEPQNRKGLKKLSFLWNHEKGIVNLVSSKIKRNKEPDILGMYTNLERAPLQDLTPSVATNDPSEIKSSPLHHMDANATLTSVAHDVFPGVKDSSSMSAHLEQQSDEAWGKMTREQRHDIYEYTRNDYSPVNSLLVDGAQNESLDDIKKLDESINNIQEGLKETVTDEDMLVYRCRFRNKHVGRSSEEDAYYDAVAHGDGSLTRPNFCSTTTSSPADALGYEGTENAYVIKVPKGTHGFYANKRAYRSENEFILDRGLKYKVAGIYERSEMQTDKEGNEHWVKAPIIALEIVPDDVPKE
jgi:hypothetical protein